MTDLWLIAPFAFVFALGFWAGVGFVRQVLPTISWRRRFMWGDHVWSVDWAEASTEPFEDLTVGLVHSKSCPGDHNLSEEEIRKFREGFRWGD